MKKFKVEVAYTFKNVWEINAKNKEEVRKIALEHCAAGEPKFMTALADTVVPDWEGDIHPDSVKVIKITKA